MQRASGSRRKWIIGLALAAVMGAIHGPARAYTVRAEHPRIWLTPSTLTYLRAKAAAGSPQWQALKGNCDTYINSTSEYDTSVLNNALVYQVTGNTLYADKAITMMQGIADGTTSTSITRDSGYDVRGLLPTLAVGYDWCYDRLTPDQRSYFRGKLEMIADWVWPETNPARANAYSIDNPGDNYYHGFMMTWLAGLALYGESPKAAGYIDNCLKRWNGRVRPYLAQYGAGGYLLEGSNYGTETTFRIFWYLSAHTSATGEDLLNAPGFTWSSEAIRTKLYITTPTMDRMYPGGEQSRVPSAPLSDYARMSALVAMAYLDKTTAGYARWWLDHISPDLAWRWELWQDFLWYRDEVQTIDYTQVLPLGYIAPGSGWMTSRSDWGRQATQVYMMCGPQLEAHQDLDQNDFMIFHGDWLAAAARLNSHDGLFRQAEYHNTFTIGDRGQPEGQAGLPKNLDHVVHFEDTARYAYFAGQAKNAYDYFQWPNAVPVLKDFYRQLLFLKPNRVVLFDRVETVDASQVKHWHLNAPNEPTIGTDTYQTTAAGATLFGKSLLPKGADIAKTPLYLGANGALSSWRVDISAPASSNLDYFLNVMEVAPADQNAPTAVLPVQTSRSTLIGAQTGNQIVVFDADSSPTGSISYHMNTATALEHFVLTQLPKAWYKVTELSPAGTSVMDARVQSSDEGVLTFPVTSLGANTIVITPDNGSSPTTPPAPTPGAGTPSPTVTPTPTPPPAPSLTPAPNPGPSPSPVPVNAGGGSPSPAAGPPVPSTVPPAGTGTGAAIPPAPPLPPAATGTGTSSSPPLIGPPVPLVGPPVPQGGAPAGASSPPQTRRFVDRRRQWLEHARQHKRPKYWISAAHR